MEIPQEYTDRIRVSPNGCWNWLGAVVGIHNKTGCRPYGALIRDNKRMRAHRYFYELATGIAPGKNHIHHKCDNSLCVNPDHLEMMSQAEHNHLHGIFQRRAEAARESPTCVRGHLWSENAYFWKGMRFCHSCRMEDQRRQRKARGEGLKGQGYNMRQRTHCPKGHPYEGENLKVTPKGWRICRTCERAKRARIRARHRAEAEAQQKLL
jgi:hypothetical protein